MKLFWRMSCFFWKGQSSGIATFNRLLWSRGVSYVCYGLWLWLLCLLSTNCSSYEWMKWMNRWLGRQRERGRDGWAVHLSIGHSFIHSLVLKARVKCMCILAFMKRSHSSTCICMYLYFQLEQRCFTQQEQLESLQEQQEEDHLKYQKRISELEAKVEQVRGGRGGKRERGDDIGEFG